MFDPDEIEALVTAEVGGSALFASRFRECAARSLLLPRRDPRRRTPLWQQRQRANQLLQVASEYGQFPIVLEAMRECLQDVYDVPGLAGLMRDIEARKVRLVEVETPAASPFARSLLFGYVGMFLYEGDAPLAERRAQALSLDSALLAELLGATELRELLDADALAAVERELTRLAAERQAHGPDAVHDLLRWVGDLSTAEALARGATPHDLEALEAGRRAIRVRVAGEQRWLAIEDAGRLRDALGVALPVGVPEAFTEPVADPLGDLVSRYARTHGPFHPADVAARLGLGVAVVDTALARLAASGRVRAGRVPPGRRRHRSGATPRCCGWSAAARWPRCAARSSRCPPQALARFLPAWQGVGTRSARGVDGVLRVVEQLAGVPLPASALETLVLPSRVADYAPGMLDELTLAGEVLWAGAGLAARQRRLGGAGPADLAPLLLPPPDEVDGDLAAGVAGRARRGSGAVLPRAGRPGPAAGADADDATSPTRSGTSSGPGASPTTRWPRCGRCSARAVAHRARAPAADPACPLRPLRRARRAAARRLARAPPRDGGPLVGGARRAITTSTRRAVAAAEALLDRYGLVTRGRSRARAGHRRVRRRLPGAQGGRGVRPGPARLLRRGARRGAVRAARRGRPAACAGAAADDAREPAPALVLAATDPANPYGAALPWPVTAAASSDAAAGRGHQPARKAGALVVLVDGACVLYVERGGRTLLSFTDDPALLHRPPTRWPWPSATARWASCRSSGPTARRSRLAARRRRWRRPASGPRRAACACAADGAARARGRHRLADRAPPRPCAARPGR